MTILPIGILWPKIHRRPPLKKTPSGFCISTLIENSSFKYSLPYFIIIQLSLFACNITKKRPTIHCFSEYFGIKLKMFIRIRLQMPSIIHLLIWLLFRWHLSVLWIIYIWGEGWVKVLRATFTSRNPDKHRGYGTIGEGWRINPTSS